MIQTPIIIPIRSSGSEQSYTQECLEKPELNTLYKKSLNQEEFSDEDVEKLSECVEDLKQSKATTYRTVLIVVLAILVVAIIISFCVS